MHKLDLNLTNLLLDGDASVRPNLCMPVSPSVLNVSLLSAYRSSEHLLTFFHFRNEGRSVVVAQNCWIKVEGKFKKKLVKYTACSKICSSVRLFNFCWTTMRKFCRKSFRIIVNCFFFLKLNYSNKTIKQ